MVTHRPFLTSFIEIDKVILEVKLWLDECSYDGELVAIAQPQWTENIIMVGQGNKLVVREFSV